MIIIDVKNLDKSINKHSILSNINFQVSAGEIHALIGSNGAGKTTTLRCVLGLLKASKGLCRVYGEQPYYFSYQTRKRLGVILDETCLIDEISALDNILFYGSLFNIKKEVIKKKFSYYSDIFALEESKHKKVGTYTKGMKQKLAIIRELIHDPELIILDEPFNGLDPVSRVSIRNFLQDLNEKGVTILISSHDLTELEKIAQKVTMIKKGSVAYSGDISNIQANAAYVVILKDSKDYRDSFKGIEGLNIISYENDVVIFACDENMMGDPLKELIIHNINVKELYRKKENLEDFFVNNN